MVESMEREGKMWVVEQATILRASRIIGSFIGKRFSY